ncbi:hypothetical protein [Chlorogloeopsis sp. ULAP02]|uniref:hypothetical protein n=1 Tax=Chlorogloeopsis sp. ULAP02 TaxID=3107926 RepID=UPI0031356D50
MPAKRSISILLLSALMALPAGIATAGDIDIQNGNTRVRIDGNNDITIKKAPSSTTSISPFRWPSSGVWIQKNRVYRVPTVKIPQTTRGYCSGRTLTQQSVKNSSSATSRTYSSTTTTSCY